MNCADVKQIYISRAETAHNEAYITNVFKRLRIGTIEEMQLIPKTNEKKHNYFGVRIRISLNKNSPIVKEMMRKFDMCDQAQIQHNPRYHWNVVRFVEKNYKEMIPAPVGFVNPTSESREAYETISPYAYDEPQYDYVPCFNPADVSMSNIMLAIHTLQHLQQQVCALNPNDTLFDIRKMELMEQMAEVQGIMGFIQQQSWQQYACEYEHYATLANLCY
jgi:hypothetical protein